MASYDELPLSPSKPFFATSQSLDLKLSSPQIAWFPKSIPIRTLSPSLTRARVGNDGRQYFQINSAPKSIGAQTRIGSPSIKYNKLVALPLKPIHLCATCVHQSAGSSVHLHSISTSNLLPFHLTHSVRFAHWVQIANWTQSVYLPLCLGLYSTLHYWTALLTTTNNIHPI